MKTYTIQVSTGVTHVIISVHSHYITESQILYLMENKFEAKAIFPMSAIISIIIDENE